MKKHARRMAVLMLSAVMVFLSVSHIVSATDEGFTITRDLKNGDFNEVTVAQIEDAYKIVNDSYVSGTGKFYVDTDGTKTQVGRYTTAVFKGESLNVGTYYVYLQGTASTLYYSVSLIGEIDVKLDAEIIGPDTVDVSMQDINDGKYDGIAEDIRKQYKVDFDDFNDGAVYTVQYLAGKNGYQALNYIPNSTAVYLYGAHAFGTSEAGGALDVGNTEEVHVSVTNAKYPGITLTKTVTATVRDTRSEPEFVYSSPASVTYNKESLKEDLTKAIAEKLSIRNPETLEEISCDPGKLEITSAIPTASYQTQTITVRFAGDDTFAPASIDVAAYILKADASIDVKNAQYTYDGTEKNTDIVAAPDDLDYVKIIAGIDGDAAGFLSLQIPKSVRDAMVIPIIPGIYEIDIYKMLQDSIGDGVALKDFQNLVNTLILPYAEYLLGGSFDAESLSQITELIKSIPELDINAVVTLGKGPKNTGIYLIGAVSTDQNYKTAMDFGYLTIAPQTGSTDSAVELRFHKPLPEGNTFEYGETEKFDLGADLFGSDDEVLTDKYIRYLYSGRDMNGMSYLSDKAPSLPGKYTETAYSIGGNYLPTPVSRSFTVNPISVRVIVNDKSKTEGSADEALTFTIEGNVIEGDDLGITLYREPGETVGKYTISAAVSNKNYAAAVQDGTYTIVPQNKKDADSSDVPETGDPSRIGLYAAVMLLSLAAALFMIRKNKDRI